MNHIRFLIRFFLGLLLVVALVIFIRDSRSVDLVSGLKMVSVTEVQNPPQAVKTVFPTGERITFGIYSNIFKVGSGELVYVGAERKNGGARQQHITMRARTFSVDDREEIYGTQDFAYPRRVERALKLFGKKEAITEVYAPDQKSVVITKTVEDATAQIQTINSERALENVLLLIYRLRNDPELVVGKTYAVNLPTQAFELLVKERANLKVPLGKFEVFYIESNPPKYKIWMTADAKRLPVRIQGLIAFGMVYMAATEVSGAP